MVNLLEIVNSGQHLDAVPPGCCVLRLARPPKDYQEKRRISAIQLEAEFALSTEDRQSIPPHLSVWVEVFTQPGQAYSFLAADSPRKLVLRLEVDRVRDIVGFSDQNNHYRNLLNILWVHLFIENTEGIHFRDNRLGAEGHAGITGLDEQSTPPELTNREAKNLRKDLRAKLAELASKDHWLLIG